MYGNVDTVPRLVGLTFNGEVVQRICHILRCDRLRLEPCKIGANIYQILQHSIKTVFQICELVLYLTQKIKNQSAVLHDFITLRKSKIFEASLDVKSRESNAYDMVGTDT